MTRELLRALQERRAARKGQPTPSDDVTTTSEFSVGQYHVRVRYPLAATWERIDSVLRRFPASSSLEAVEEALAELGAAFAPWADEEPGHGGAYFSRAERELLEGFAVPQAIETAGALLAELTADASHISPQERRDPRYRALTIQFPPWDWARVLAVARCSQVSRRAELARRWLLKGHLDDELHAIDREWE